MSNLDPKTQKFLDDADAVFARAKEAATGAELLIARIEKDYAAAEKKNEDAQAAADKKIRHIVKRMDAATLRFIKNTGV